MNIDCERLNWTSTVVLAGEINQYYLATINNEVYTVIMSGHKQREQQKFLDTLCHATKMRAKGYRFILIPKLDKSGKPPFEPLYSKTIKGVSDLLKDWNRHKFDVHSLMAN